MQSSPRESRNTNLRTLNLLRHNGESILAKKKLIPDHFQGNKRARQYKQVLEHETGDVAAWNAKKSVQGASYKDQRRFDEKSKSPRAVGSYSPLKG